MQNPIPMQLLVPVQIRHPGTSQHPRAPHHRRGTLQQLLEPSAGKRLCPGTGDCLGTGGVLILDSTGKAWPGHFMGTQRGTRGAGSQDSIQDSQFAGKPGKDIVPAKPEREALALP